MIISSTGRGNTLVPYTLNCIRTNQYFFPQTNTDNTVLNIIQPVWDELASSYNLDFIAMSGYLNFLKGSFFNPSIQYIQFTSRLIPDNGAGWIWPTTHSRGVYSAYDTLITMINQLEKILYGVLEMNTDNMLPLIDKTNNRIYAALLVCVNIILRRLVANESQPRCRQYN